MYKFSMIFITACRAIAFKLKGLRVTLVGAVISGSLLALKMVWMACRVSPFDYMIGFYIVMYLISCAALGAAYDAWVSEYSKSHYKFGGDYHGKRYAAHLLDLEYLKRPTPAAGDVEKGEEGEGKEGGLGEDEHVTNSKSRDS
jgi:hypothetical protein